VLTTVAVIAVALLMRELRGEPGAHSAGLVVVVAAAQLVPEGEREVPDLRAAGGAG
jgi:hypothetical protein